MDKISVDTFKQIDIRVGTVLEAQVPAWSHWVMKLTVDFGQEIGQRTIFAGIMHFFKVEDLVGRQFPFIVNINPKKIGPEGDESCGMLLAVSSVQEKPLLIGDEEIAEKPVLLAPIERVPDGSKIL